MCVIANVAAHEFLIANGYFHTHHARHIEECGDPENGPRMSVWPAYDEYRGDIDFVFIEEDGTANREMRDLEWERIEDEMEFVYEQQQRGYAT